MKNRPGSINEPRDLGREWHSDSTFQPTEYNMIPDHILLYSCLVFYHVDETMATDTLP